jgi:hypothetical protein
MAYQVTLEHVWVGAIPDRPAALGEKLKELALGGINLELIIGRREMPGRALLYISPLRTLDEIKRAERTGLSRENSMRTLRIEGPNRPGLGAKIAGALADAGINIASFTAAALGNLHVTNIGFDHPDDVDRAKAILEKVLS